MRTEYRFLSEDRRISLVAGDKEWTAAATGGVEVEGGKC